jgi:hypothetical protein
MTHHISNQGTDHLISQTLKITLKSSELEGGGTSQQPEARSRSCSAKDTKQTSQTGSTNWSDQRNYDETTKNAQTEESRSRSMEGGQDKGKR